MVKLKIIQVGDSKENAIEDIISNYQKMMGQFFESEIINVKDLSIDKNQSEQNIIEQESIAITKKLDLEYFNIALDKSGRDLNSIQFANLIREKKDFGNAKICFIIGGSLGLSTRLLNKVNLTLSFSKFTFNHQLIRYILWEQLYRAYTIIINKRYHH